MADNFEKVFLLQGDPDVLPHEKIACSMSDFRCEYCTYDKLEEFVKSVTKDRNIILNRGVFYKYCPVGSVEFFYKYMELTGIEVPYPMGYLTFSAKDKQKVFKREIRLDKLADVKDHEFVKPADRVKLFTGCPKKDAPKDLDPQTKVWISEPVKFETEYRVYITSNNAVSSNITSGFNILGWARYDELDVENPPFKPEYIIDMCKKIYYDAMVSPIAFSIDIGWRPDLQEYDVVEVNDAWSLGLFLNSDKNSNPPSVLEYAEMLMSRWHQICFIDVIGNTRP